MPCYEYECQKCGHKFEVSKPLYHIGRKEPCEYCTSFSTKRIISSGATHIPDHMKATK